MANALRAPATIRVVNFIGFPPQFGFQECKQAPVELELSPRFLPSAESSYTSTFGSCKQL
jgi:hypothetical protein